METTTAASRTLLLSQSYEPIKVINWRRAITLLTLGKIEIVETYDGYVRSSTAVIKIPAVVRLLRSFKRFRCTPKFSRTNVYARDGGKCAYCGKRFPLSSLTYDHVLPRTQGGKTEWNNIVLACPPDNARKGGRTPEQAGMKLLWKPTRPAHLFIEFGIRVSEPPMEWGTWLQSAA